ncbi:MAG: 4Fe-4S binding protein [Clostridia bacterium]
MHTYAIQFSPTGGTAHVMTLLADTFAPQTHIDLTNPDTPFAALSLQPDDLCLFGVPSYGGRVPQIALERISQIKGNGAKAILVVVYGNRAYDDTLLELQNTLTACGFQPISAIAAVAEHSIMHQFAAGRPDALDQQELQSFAQAIQARLSDPAPIPPLQLPGKQPYRTYGGVPFKPQANQKCTHCGLCAAQCPVAAISRDDPSRTDSAKCISCMRCVSLCPQNARKLNKALLLVASQKMKKACNTRKGNELFL